MVPIKLRVWTYEAEDGSSPFAKWFNTLDAVAAAKVTIALTRLGHGNTSNVKGVNKGVLELKIDFGSGYRVYFAMDRQEIVILLGGGRKKSKLRDISAAHKCWQDFKQRKKGGV
jgi:putative addiction module killer protein